MKSKKKVAMAGCALAVTLSTTVIVMMSGKKVSDKVGTNYEAFQTMSGKKKSTVSSPQQIKVVYEAIKENNIEIFESYLEEGGSLNEVIEVNGSQMTLAEAIVHHERLEFIQKAASINVAQASHTNHEFHQTPKNLSGDGHKDHLSESESASLSPGDSYSLLVPLLQVVARSAKPEFKKAVLGLLKTNPELVRPLKGAASEVLPEVVATCDQEQISFLGDLGADPLVKNNEGRNGIDAAGKTKCFKAISYWKKDQKIDFDKKNEEGISGFDVLAKFKDPELQSFTDKLQGETIREISSLKPKVKRVSFYKKRVPSAIIDPEALVEPELRPDEATETAEFSEFSD